MLSWLVILSAYSGAIVSNLSTPSYLPFSTMDEMVHDGTYKIILLASNPFAEVYKVSDGSIIFSVRIEGAPSDILYALLQSPILFSYCKKKNIT